MKRQKTYSAKLSDVKREWIIVDASELPLGRVATTIASRLIGKHRANYTPHMDSGDYVIVINADKLRVTGTKESDKVYYRHTGYPGGIRSRTLAEQRAKDSTEIVRSAVKGMLPKNKLQAVRMGRLKVFADEAHEHEAQKPQKVTIG